MNDGRGPDLLGVCEVENEGVMQRLIQALAPLGRNYCAAHHDTSDQRGIDVGFIYDGALFTAAEQFSHFVMRRTATRDLLQVNFKTAAGRTLVVVGNHWPSRSGGRLESEPYRMIAGETLAYFHQRILEVLRPGTPVLAMGDFNDEPFDRSLQDYARAVRSRLKVTNARIPMFVDLMWPLMGACRGTFFFENSPYVLDQFLANKALVVKKAPLRVVAESVGIVCFPDMIAAGEYSKPRPFGGMGKPVDPDGFSDHFPVCMLMEES